MRRNESKSSTLNRSFPNHLQQLQQQPQQQIYDSIIGTTTKPLTPLQYNNTTTITNNDSINHSTATTTSSSSSSTIAHRPEYLNFERNTLDYRLKNQQPIGDAQNNFTDCRSLNRAVAVAGAHNNCNNSNNSSSKSIIDDNYHHQQQQHRYSGSDFMTNNIDFSLTNNSNQLTNNMSSLLPNVGRIVSSTSSMPVSSTATLTNSKNGRQSRNHIITDTLPGPESCV